MNYGVLYEIYTIMLFTPEEGRVVQFPNADFTLDPLIKKISNLMVRAFAKEKLGLVSWIIVLMLA